jgi:hypothetical protein
MKRTLALISTAILVALLIIPAGTALADQSFHTVSLPLSLTTAGADAGHTLRNGWVTRIHANGPINYAIGSYILNGAKSDTTYDICWEFEEYGWLPIYEYHFIETDKNGNGNLHWKASPALVPIPPNTTLHAKVEFIAGGTPVYIPAYGIWTIVGGVVVFETEVFEIYFD